MREEIKCKVEYFGPSNLDNKVYIRKKNANLIRFSYAICHMKDIKFYQYKKILILLCLNKPLNMAQFNK